MKKNIRGLRALKHWFETPVGERVAKAFAHELSPCTSLKGEHLVQLGEGGEEAWLKVLPYKHTWVVSPCISSKVHVASAFHELPFETNSIDCLIAPLTLHNFTTIDEIVQEVHRVLKSTGIMIVFGIQPLSFWGFSQYFGRNRCFGEAATSLHAASFIRDTLERIGFHQYFFNTFYYIPPIQSPHWINRLEFLNEMGKMACLFPAGFYCLIMQKYEIVSPNLMVLETEPKPVELLNGITEARGGNA